LPRTFLDTNVLVYAEDAADPVKQRKAIELYEEHRRNRTGVVSLQILQEYFVNVTRKMKLDPQVARRKIELLSTLDVAEPGLADILAAIDLHRLHGLSFWDALVIHMAKRAGCRVVLSEDMQNGRTFEGVTIVNPFL
jgi:predicted nucleic acid-binding protein